MANQQASFFIKLDQMIICTVFALHYYPSSLGRIEPTSSLQLSQWRHQNHCKIMFCINCWLVETHSLSLSKIKSNGTETQKPETKDELELDSTMSQSRIEFWNWIFNFMWRTRFLMFNLAQIFTAALETKTNWFKLKLDFKLKIENSVSKLFSGLWQSRVQL